MSEPRKYLGGDNQMRSKEEHLAYLERCAKDWENQFVPPWYGKESQQRMRDSHLEQAERIRAKIKRLREEE